MQKLNIRIKKMSMSMSMSMFMHYNPRRFCDIFKKGPNPHIVLKSSTYFIGLLVHHKHWFEPVKCHNLLCTLKHISCLYANKKTEKLGLDRFIFLLRNPENLGFFFFWGTKNWWRRTRSKANRQAENPFISHKR